MFRFFVRSIVNRSPTWPLTRQAAVFPQQNLTMSRTKHSAPGGYKQHKKRKGKATPANTGTSEEVLQADVTKLLVAQLLKISASDGDGQADKPDYEPPERFSEIEVTVSEISSSGDGLALSENSDHVYVVPFTTPGDVVRAKVIIYNAAQNYTLADFVGVVKPSSMRDDSRIKCPYFSKCSGCQFQMMSYEDQLAHKKTIIERAYMNFSNLTPESIPSVLDTVGSPLQYGYRTKLTPHFDGPPGMGRRARKDGVVPKFEQVPPIGFMQKGTRRTIDIEDCPIGTDAVRAGIQSERKRVVDELVKYKKGATLLLRESTERTPNEAPRTRESAEPKSAHPDGNTVPPTSYTETKTCITDSNATSTEYVDDFVFTNPAGSFFQNNNSILPRFTQYIRDHVLSNPDAPPPSTSSCPSIPPITHLLDAYSGSGLFTITLSSLFSTSTGIDISGPSIAYATRNAELNHTKNAQFVTATASTIFQGVTAPPDETVVIIDPPRKGCDGEFLEQLLKYAPKRVVYVSCNVHTQARDVGVLVEGKEFGDETIKEKMETPVKEGEAEMNEESKSEDSKSEELKQGTTLQGASESTQKQKTRTRYRLESLRGFDFFPQTGHVEGVAVLERVDGAEDPERRHGYDE